MPVRVVHVIPSLGIGGAEAMLVKLLVDTDLETFPSLVITLLGERENDAILRDHGVPIVNLGSARGRIPTPGAWRDLLVAVRRWRPQIVQGWIYHGNVAAAVAGRTVARTAHVAWNVRHSLHDIRHETRITRWTIRASAPMSGRARRIIYNSHTSRQQHEAAGFAADDGLVIPNGFDLARFRPDDEARAAVCREFRMSPDDPLLVKVGRLHPMKGHASFLAAVATVRRRRPEVKSLLIGPEDVIDRPAMDSLIAEQGLAGHVRYVGPRRDLERFYAAADVVCLASRWGEAFPNVVGEAMACGTPCVATDVGDCARIIGDTGSIVAPGDSAALAVAIEEMLSRSVAEREKAGLAARARVRDHYALDSVVARYEGLYRDLAGRGRR